MSEIDELMLVTEVGAEVPPPSPTTLAAQRARLSAAIAAEVAIRPAAAPGPAIPSVGTRFGAGRPRLGARATRGRWWAVAGGSLTVTAAAAALLAMLMGPGAVPGTAARITPVQAPPDQGTPARLGTPPVTPATTQPAPGQVLPGHLTPGYVMPGYVTPDQGTPAPSAPGQGAPGQGAPGQPTPTQSAPGQGTSPSAPPGQPQPTQSSPGQAPPVPLPAPPINESPGVPQPDQFVYRKTFMPGAVGIEEFWDSVDGTGGDYIIQPAGTPIRGGTNLSAANGPNYLPDFPTQVSEVEQFLEQQFPGQSDDPATRKNEAESIFEFDYLTPPQTAALYQFFVSLPGVTIVSDLTDPFGRRVVGVEETLPDGEFSGDLWIFSQQTFAYLGVAWEGVYNSAPAWDVVQSPVGPLSYEYLIVQVAFVDQPGDRPQS